MEHQPNGNKHFHCRHHFITRRDTEGCDETYDIVFQATGDVVAYLPFWYDNAGARRDAKLLIRALNALYNRGGQFYGPALLRTNAAFKPRSGEDAEAL